MSRAANIRALPEVDWRRVARLALLSRTIDETEERELVPAGKITYQFSAKGHELAQVLLGLHLTHPHDGATVYYRSRPFMLACGFTAQEALAAGMARLGTPTEGRDVGVMFSMPSRGSVTVLPTSGDVGAQYTPAAGWAQAITYYREQLEEQDWEGAMAAALGGDGSVASAGFWSALTIATTLELPLLFFIEDNGYGISVPRHFQTPGGDITANLASFRHLHILNGSGTEPEEAASLVQQAVAHVRAGRGPCLLRLEVPRLTGHTFGEDQTAYKSTEVIAEEQARDPLTRLRGFLEGQLDWPALEEEVQAEVRAALEAAQQAPTPDPCTATDHLFFDGKPPLVPVMDPELAAPATTEAPEPQLRGPRVNLVDAVRRTMEVELARNPRLLIFGEDVGARGGVHRATLDLQLKFGVRRVFDTSLSEEGIIGRAIGMALAGLRPLPEIQFRKYADPAYEQIHDAGWLRWRTAGKFAAPLVVRIPVGFSKRTGDPWHSVSDEVIYAHTPGWRVAFPSNASDAVGLLRSALRGQDPVIFLEHRALLDTPAGRRPYPGDDYLLPFGRAAVLCPGRWLTVVSWGEMVHRCLEAAGTFGEDVEVLDLRTIIPWDKEAVLASVRKTGKCLVAHEDTLTAGLGAEIVAVIAGEAFSDLDAPVVRVAVPDVPIPYHPALMDAVVPGVDLLRARMEALLRW